MVSGWGQGAFLSRAEGTKRLGWACGQVLSLRGNVFREWLASRQVQFWHLCTQRAGVGWQPVPWQDRAPAG